MPTSTCQKKCCTIHFELYEQKFDEKRRDHWSNSKAGAFIYDPVKRKILLVQSKGVLWGPPKGSRKFRESYKDCALREVQEETGIILSTTSLDKYIMIHKSMYYYIEYKETDVNVQHYESDQSNDANAVGWINVDCLKSFIISGEITLTSHAEILISRFLGLSFESPEFTLVTRKNKKGIGLKIISSMRKDVY